MVGPVFFSVTTLALFIYSQAKFPKRISFPVCLRYPRLALFSSASTLALPYFLSIFSGDGGAVDINPIWDVSVLAMKEQDSTKI